MTQELVKLDALRKAIAKASTVREIKGVRDKAEAARIYARDRNMKLEIQNDLAEGVVESEAKCGEMLAAMDKRHGARDGKTGSDNATPLLSDLGLDKHQSSRWQLTAEVSSKRRREYYKQQRDEREFITSNDVQRIARHEAVEAKLEGIRGHSTRTPKGKYDTIVIDPPWPTEMIKLKARPNQVGFQYPTMTEHELEALKIPVAKDCHVWLWTTHRFLPMAFRLLASWELKYVCTFVWHKGNGYQPIGLPKYNCEFALYARHGAPAFVDLKKFSVCFKAKQGAHSEKPGEFYDLVRRVTHGRRLDMFNRRKISGFEGWGKEAAK